MNRYSVLATLAALLALGSLAARADEQYPNDFRLGVYYIYYDTSADDITGPFTPAGINLKVESLETLYAAYVHDFSEHIDIEIAFGYPPLTKTQGKGPATVGSVPYNGQVIATARWLAPSALLQYKFFNDSYALRPYVGLGLNYTRFYSRQSTA
ncbi:MAG TPA: OmpW family outer membrane protein, partial [Steroidobacteraceae bacterium]|nr:OmpW family outer membrane protein [Steroidobacteraceae bacterium]